MDTDDSPRTTPDKPLDPILLRAARRAQKNPEPDDGFGWNRGTLSRFLVDAQAAWFEVER